MEEAVGWWSIFFSTFTKTFPKKIKKINFSFGMFCALSWWQNTKPPTLWDGSRANAIRKHWALFQKLFMQNFLSCLSLHLPETRTGPLQTCWASTLALICMTSLLFYTGKSHEIWSSWEAKKKKKIVILKSIPQTNKQKT